MIHKASIVLVIDTNILLSILSDHASKNLITDLRTWAAKLVRAVEPAPRGKMITILVTKPILRDYWTGLNRGGYKVNQGTKKVFDVYLGKKIPLDRDRKTSFSVRTVQEKSNLGKVNVGDRYDLPYPRLLLTIAGEPRWSDRHVIFGSSDTKLLGNTRNVMLHKAPAGRFHFAPTRADFEEIIMC